MLRVRLRLPSLPRALLSDDALDSSKLRLGDRWMRVGANEDELAGIDDAGVGDSGRDGDGDGIDEAGNGTSIGSRKALAE